MKSIDIEFLRYKLFTHEKLIGEKLATTLDSLVLNLQRAIIINAIFGSWLVIQY